MTVALGLSAGAIGLVQSVDLLGSNLSGAVAYLILLLAPTAILLALFAVIRWEGRPLRDFGFSVRGPPAATLAFVSLLALLFVALRIDPGFILGFGRIAPYPPLVFGFFLLGSPVIALAEVALFAGYVFRVFARTLPLRLSMLLSAGLFAAYSTDFSVFRLLSPLGGAQYLITTTFVAFVFGMVLALYMYKSQWSLLGPFTLAAVLRIAEALLPVGVRFPNWGTDFAASMVAYAVLLLAVGIGLQEPRLQALRYLGTRVGPRRLRFRQRARDRAAVGSTIAGSAAVGVAVLSVAYLLPFALGTSTPFLAIATGSMVPTFHRGEFVVVEHVAATAIHVGTIIAFSVSCLPSPTVHRVIKIVSTGPNWVFQTKGDANPVQDPCTVPYGHVLGAVVFYVPDVGFLILDPLFAASVVALILIVPWAVRGSRA